MPDTLRAQDRRNLFSPDAAGNREQKSPARSSRFARTTIGFWLGAVTLGAAGCILGVCMPYHRPVAMVISALWWGIYLGCFGGSVGTPQLGASLDDGIAAVRGLVAVSWSVARGEPVRLADVTGQVLSAEEDKAVSADRRNGVQLLSA